MNPKTVDEPSDSDRSLSPTEAAPPSAFHRIFIGPDGLRAGWGLLIFIALFAAMMYSAHVIGLKLHPPAPKAANASTDLSLLHGLVNESVPLLIVLLVTWIMSKIERRPVAVYGFGDGRKLSHFLAGLGWGVVCLSMLIATLLKTGFLVIDRRLLFGSVILGYGTSWLLGFVLVGLLEEYLTRGLAGLYQSAFKTRHSVALGFWTSAVIFSVLFGLSHGNNPGESPIGLLCAGLGGLVFCFSLWRTGSLWWAIGFHTSWDWSQNFLYGVADSGVTIQHRLLLTHPVGKPILSGGATGPEGSIFIAAILPIIFLIILFTLPRGQYGKGAKVFESQ